MTVYAKVGMCGFYCWIHDQLKECTGKVTLLLSGWILTSLCQICQVPLRLLIPTLAQCLIVNPLC